MTTRDIIITARKHLGVPMVSSARLCLEDALERYDFGDYDAARMWALRSLSYSVGIFHADYERAAR